MEQTNDQNFLPRHPNARFAVENARKKILQNREFIDNLKKENQVLDEYSELSEDQLETIRDYKTNFELSKIRSTNGFSDFFKEMFSI